MKKQDSAFWFLIVSLIFGVALHWPALSKFLMILLYGTVLVQVRNRLYHAYIKER